MALSIYDLNDFNNIKFNGFDISLPKETIDMITQLSLQVGSPTYIKTPIFNKNENNITKKVSCNDGVDIFKKKRRTKTMEVNDADWDSYQTTKMDKKEGVEEQIVLLRTYLNKISDKSYDEPCEKIVEIINGLSDENDLIRVGTIIFDIASNNRFYSKLYATFFGTLVTQYPFICKIFYEKLEIFIGLFETIVYIDSEKDYDAFCIMNRDNERRKAMSSFIVNLMKNGIVKNKIIIDIASNLLNKMLVLIFEADKKNEVDEITENLVLLFDKAIFNEDCLNLFKFEGESMTFLQIMAKFATCKAKMYPSLSNKAIFKFMDHV